jgi:hypothetical protein
MVPTDRLPTPAESRRIAARRVLFGHQSVGGNLLRGVEAIGRSQPDLAVPVAEAGGAAGAGIVHFRVGRNGDPVSKIDDFLAHLDAEAAETPDLAGFKLCYADFGKQIDVDALFARYAAAIDQTRRRHPGLRLFHVTTPLERAEPGWRVLAKRVLGKTPAQELNAVRERYNDALRRAFAGREPLFDLAREEASAGGAPVTAGTSAGRVLALAPPFTDDGAHLNESGGRVLAARWLRFLAAALEPEP